MAVGLVGSVVNNREECWGSHTMPLVATLPFGAIVSTTNSAQTARRAWFDPNLGRRLSKLRYRGALSYQHSPTSSLDTGRFPSPEPVRQSILATLGVAKVIKGFWPCSFEYDNSYYVSHCPFYILRVLQKDDQVVGDEGVLVPLFDLGISWPRSRNSIPLGGVKVGWTDV